MITGRIFDETGLLPKGKRLHVQDKVWERIIGGWFYFENFFLLVFSGSREVQPCEGFAESSGICGKMALSSKGFAGDY